MTQEMRTQEHLVQHGSATSWEFIREYRITRLAHYVNQLRKDGWEIDTIRQREFKNGNTFARYVLRDVPFGIVSEENRRSIVQRGDKLSQYHNHQTATEMS